MYFLQTLFFVCACMSLVTDAWSMKHVLDELEAIPRDERSYDQKMYPIQPDAEKVLTVESSDGEAIQVSVAVVLLSPFFEFRLKNLLRFGLKNPSAITETYSKRYRFSQINSETMKMVLHFMQLKLKNGNIDTAVDEYINNMSVGEKVEAVFAAARHLGLKWLQSAMVKAGFRPPLTCTKQDEDALMKSIDPHFHLNRELNGLSLKTLMCLKVAELYEYKGTLEDTEYINLPQNLLEHVHVLHALQYGLSDGMIAPHTSLHDLAKAGIISMDTSGSNSKTDAEIIEYFVENNEISNLDLLLLLSRSNEWSKTSFNIPELLFEQLEKLDLQKLVDAIKLMRNRRNSQRLEPIYRFVLAVRDESNALNTPQDLRVLFWELYYFYNWNLTPLSYFLNHKKLIELLGIHLIKEFLVVMVKDDDQLIDHYVHYKYAQHVNTISTWLMRNEARSGNTIPSTVKANIVKTMLCNKHVLELFNTDPGAVSELLEMLTKNGHKKIVHEITSDSNYLSWSYSLAATLAPLEEVDTDEEPSV